MLITWLDGSKGEVAREFPPGYEKWQKECRQLIEKVLSSKPHLVLYSFDIGYTKNAATLNVKIDSTANKYGSPTIDECEEVAREVKNEVIILFDNNNGPEDFNLEVSSAGAERELFELEQVERFKELPMKIQYYNETQKVQTAYVKFVSYTEGQFVWQLVSTKKKKLEKSQQTELRVPLGLMKKINLYLDF